MLRASGRAPPRGPGRAHLSQTGCTDKLAGSGPGPRSRAPAKTARVARACLPQRFTPCHSGPFEREPRAHTLDASKDRAGQRPQEHDTHDEQALGCATSLAQTASDCQEDELEPGDEIDIGIPDEEECEDQEVDPALSDCDATVAEYERCMSGYVEQMRGQLSSVQCEMLSDLENQADDEEIGIEDIEECKPIRDKCPDLDPFGDDTDEEGDGLDRD